MAYLVSDIRSVVSGDAWHGPSWRDVLAGISAQQASLHVVPNAHSIYDLVHHTAAWAAEVARCLRGATAGMPPEGDYPPNDATVDETAWHGAVARLYRAHEDLVSAIERFDSARLDERVGTDRDAPLGSGVTYRATIAGLLAHTAYHAGQAMMLRRALEGPVRR